MRYTNRLIQYMKENRINIHQIEKELDIESGILDGEVSGRALRADEFLEICKYLHIKPEELG